MAFSPFRYFPFCFYDESKSALFLLKLSLLPAAVTHRDVGIVAADKYLTALGHDLTVAVDSRVNYRLVATGTNCFYLVDRIGNLKESLTSLKQICEKVGAKSKAKHGNIVLVDDAAKLIDLLSGEKLTFVGNDRVHIPSRYKFGENIGLARHHEGFRRKSYARAHNADAVAVVDSGLDEPHTHSAFLVIKFSYQSVCRF